MDINSVEFNDDKHCITAMSPFATASVGMLLVPAFLCGVAWVRSRQSLPKLQTLSDEQPTIIAQQPMREQCVLEPTEASPTDHKRPARSVLEGLMFSYFGMTKKAIDLLSCIRVGNQRLVTIDKSHECHDSEHLLVEVLAISVLLVITITLPLLIVYKSWKHNRRGKDLQNVTFARTISLFHARYNWWMAWLLFRRVILATAFVYGHTHDATLIDGIIDWRASAFVVLVISAMLQNFCQPFLLPADNRLEQTTLQMLIFAIYIDMADASADNDIARFAVLVSIVIVALALFVGDAPIVKNVKHTLCNPRETIAYVLDKVKTAVASFVATIVDKCACCPCFKRTQTDLATTMWAEIDAHGNEADSSSTMREHNPVVTLTQ